MTKPELLNLLTAINATWPQFALSEAVTDIWWKHFENEHYPASIAAVLELGKDPEQKFPPHPGAILGHGKTSAKQEAQEAWTAITTRKQPANSEVAKRAWERWGGGRRWGLLPDPRYATNGETAERTVSMARAEFIDLYVTEVRQAGVTTTAARLEANGADMKRIGGAQ